MNIRRGLIRLWVVSSAIWIAGVVAVAMHDPNMRDQGAGDGWEDASGSAPNGPAPAFSIKRDAPPITFTPVAPHGGYDDDPLVPDPRTAAQPYPFTSAIWKYASVALGAPLALFVFGAGACWVAIGFGSDAAARLPESMPPSAPAEVARNRRWWRILLPLTALFVGPHLGNDGLAATFLVVALLPACLR